MAHISVSHQINCRLRYPAAAAKNAKARLSGKSHRHGNCKNLNSGRCLHSRALGGSIKTELATDSTTSNHQTWDHSRRCLKQNAIARLVKTITPTASAEI